MASNPDTGAAESDSVTTGIKLLTSALVTSVRFAAEMAWAGSAAYWAATSGSRTTDITKSSSEFATGPPLSYSVSWQITHCLARNVIGAGSLTESVPNPTPDQSR